MGAEPLPFGDDQRHLLEHDVWDLRHLGAINCAVAHAWTLNFSPIEQPWLRYAAKQYVRHSLASKTGGTCVSELSGIKGFAAFLQRRYPAIRAHELDRSVILAYLADMSTRSLKTATRRAHTAYLRSFLETCAREGWAEVPQEPLIRVQDYPRRLRPQPRFIPQEVLDELNRHRSELPTRWERMLVIVQECGMRLSELLNLPHDCLIRDAAGDWFLRSYQYKMKKEHSVPISRDVADAIRRQQQDVTARWGPHAPHLFPNRIGRPYRPQSFAAALNRLARAKDIRTAAGHPFRFHAHQFRHTVGTRMINNGVPQHIVQRFLGHESPEMTTGYAYILDQTLKEEFARFRSKVVDITGAVVEQDARVADLQWLKRTILGQALPNGYCGLPVAAGPCPHANACLTCAHFRTDRGFLPRHEAHLDETHRIIQVARAQGWTRQAEMNERVATNLDAIIASLKDRPDDA